MDFDAIARDAASPGRRRLLTGAGGGIAAAILGALGLSAALVDDAAAGKKKGGGKKKKNKPNNVCTAAKQAAIVEDWRDGCRTYCELHYNGTDTEWLGCYLSCSPCINYIVGCNEDAAVECIYNDFMALYPEGTP